MQVSTRISIGKNKVGCCALRRDILCLGGSGADNPRGKGPCLFMSQLTHLFPSSFLDKIGSHICLGSGNPHLLEENHPGDWCAIL